jgi:hypothetical protein
MRPLARDLFALPDKSNNGTALIMRLWRTTEHENTERSDG